MKQGFLPREALILDFVYSVLIQSQNLRIEIDTLWSHVFELLSTILLHSKQPYSHLWCLAILQELDLKQPSKEACFSNNPRRNKRDLADLSRSIAAISARQFHLRFSVPIAFDISPPLPPVSSHLFEQLHRGILQRFAETRGLPQLPIVASPQLLNPVLPETQIFSQHKHQNEDNDNQLIHLETFFTEERNPIEIFSQHGFSSIIGFCHQSCVTRRRTAISAVVIQIFVEESTRIMLPAALGSSSLEVSKSLISIRI